MCTRLLRLDLVWQIFLPRLLLLLSNIDGVDEVCFPLKFCWWIHSICLFSGEWGNLFISLNWKLQALPRDVIIIFSLVRYILVCVQRDISHEDSDILRGSLWTAAFHQYLVAAKYPNTYDSTVSHWTYECLLKSSPPVFGRSRLSLYTLPIGWALTARIQNPAVWAIASLDFYALRTTPRGLDNQLYERKC